MSEVLQWNKRSTDVQRTPGPRLCKSRKGTRVGRHSDLCCNLEWRTVEWEAHPSADHFCTGLPVDCNVAVPTYGALTGCTCSRSHLKIQVLLLIQAGVLTLKGPSPCPVSPQSLCHSRRDRVLDGGHGPGLGSQSYPPFNVIFLRWLLYKARSHNQTTSKGFLDQGFVCSRISMNITPLRHDWRHSDNRQEGHINPQVKWKWHGFLFGIMHILIFFFQVHESRVKNHHQVDRMLPFSLPLSNSNAPSPNLALLTAKSLLLKFKESRYLLTHRFTKQTHRLTWKVYQWKMVSISLPGLWLG